MSFARRTILILSAIAAVTLYLYAAHPESPTYHGRIVEAGHMLSPRSGHTATLLKDGRVLIAGGMVRNGEFLDSAELYDPNTHRFTPTGRMFTKRVGLAATLLADGRVLIVGGWSPGPTDAAEIYDPKTGKFSQLPPMTEKRARPETVLLHDGQVLIAGGGSSDRVGERTAELFDPKTGGFTRTGDMHDGRIAHTASLLPDGTVLVAGGMANGSVVASADLYDPKTGKFPAVGPMKQVRYKHTAQTLIDGRVLIAGGSDDNDWKGMLAEAEIYDPATRSFTTVSAMSEKRFKLDGTAALLADGNVLIAGGSGTAEVFDAKRGSFETLDTGTGTPQWYLSETSLKNGEVLLLGGYSTSMQATDRAWVYRPESKIRNPGSQPGL